MNSRLNVMFWRLFGKFTLLFTFLETGSYHLPSCQCLRVGPTRVRTKKVQKGTASGGTSPPTSFRSPKKYVGGGIFHVVRWNISQKFLALPPPNIPGLKGGDHYIYNYIIYSTYIYIYMYIIVYIHNRSYSNPLEIPWNCHLRPQGHASCHQRGTTELHGPGSPRQDLQGPELERRAGKSWGKSWEMGKSMRTQRFVHGGLEGNSPKPWASMGKSMNIDGDFPAMFDFRVEQLRIWVYIRHFEDGMWFRKNCSEKKSFAPGAGVHQLQLALAEMRSFSIQSSHEVRGSPVDLFIFGDPWNPLDTQCRRLFKSSLWTPKSSH